MDYNMIAQIVTLLIGLVIALWAGGSVLLQKIVQKLREAAELSMAQERFFNVAAEALQDGRITPQEVQEIVQAAQDWFSRLRALIAFLDGRSGASTTAMKASVAPQKGVQKELAKIFLQEVRG